MSLPSRFWNSITLHSPHSVRYCALQIDAITDRDEDRINSSLCSESYSYLFAFIHKRRDIACFFTKILIAAYENCFGASDRWPIDEQSHMRGDAQAARVSYALPVKHHY